MVVLKHIYIKQGHLPMVKYHKNTQTINLNFPVFCGFCA